MLKGTTPRSKIIFVICGVNIFDIETTLASIELRPVMTTIYWFCYDVGLSPMMYIAVKSRIPSAGKRSKCGL